MTRQSIQRCRSQTEKLFGKVHRLSRDGHHTDCSLSILSGPWYILGDEDSHPVNCKECDKQTDAYQQSISKRYAEIRSQ